MEDAVFSVLELVYQLLKDDPEKLLWLGLIGSVVALGVKLAFKEPRPDDPWWKRLLWSVAKWGDRISLNTEPVSKLEARASRRPPPPQVPPTLMVLALAFLAACSSTQTRVHAQVADPIVYELLTAAGDIIEREAAGDLAAIPDGSGREEAVRELRARYAPVEAAFEAARIAQNAYVDAIQARHAGGPPIPASVAMALLARWQELIRIAEQAIGAKLPEPPDVLRALAVGAP